MQALPLQSSSPNSGETHGQQPPDGSGKGAARQGRRKTLPPPVFVESLERLAALHR